MSRSARESGVVLIACLVIVLVFSAIGLAIAQTIGAQYVSYHKRLFVENALSAADAGLSATIAQLNKDAAFGGFAGEQELYSTADRGKATYTTSVSTDSGQNKIIIATGKTYRSQSDTTASNTKQVRAVALLKREKISNSVIFGSGGIYMGQNSRINKGNVYIRGQILGMESGTAIGTVSLPVTMNIANVGCGTTGPSSNWPQPCGAASPPIKMVGAGGTIYGTVCATDQVSTAGIVPTTGLTPNCKSDISSAPTFNKKGFVESINGSGGLVVDATTQSCGSGGNFTIAANTKFVGTLNLSSFWAACNITIEGNIYITGALNLGSNVTLRVSENLGTVRPMIVTNTGVQVSAATAKALPNSFGTPMFLIAFGSTSAACSNSETVPSDTQQTCLTNDQARLSANPIPFSVSGGSGTIDMTGMVLYGYYGPFIIQSTNLTWAFYAFGAQGGGFAPGSQLSTVADDAPFGNLLYVPAYQLIDYKQVY